MILIDNRTGSKELAPKITGAKLGRLEFADVAFVGMIGTRPVQIGIELKKLPDLISCIRNGRFAGHQLPGMQRDYDFIYLIVQGIHKRGKDGLLETPRRGGWKAYAHGGAMSWAALQSWYTTMEAKAGVRIRFTRNQSETIRIIRSLYTWWTIKKWEDHRSHMVFDSSAAPAAVLHHPLIRRIAKELTGVGWEKSAAVAKHFKTVGAVMSATEKQWQAIEGIGPILSAKIVKELHQ
jgi:ERCC4-type nuclease